LSKKDRKSPTNESVRKQERSEDTVQFTDKERKAKDVANKQTRGGFE